MTAFSLILLLRIELDCCDRNHPGTRNSSLIGRVELLTAETHPPIICCRGVTDQRFPKVSRTASQSTPGFSISIGGVIQLHRLESFNLRLSGRVGGLSPLVTPPQLGEDDFEVKTSVFSSEVLQLVQPGEQESRLVPRSAPQ